MWPLGVFYFTSAKSSLRNAQRPMPMRWIFWLTIAVACCASLLTAVVTNAALRHESLKNPEDFANINDEKARSVALFEEAAKVILHPRCANCHPAGDRPHQGDDSRLHQPPITRGADNHGAVGMRCTTCHGPSNFERAPGNPRWQMAPIEMAWFGKSLAYICAQIKDPKRNGGMTLDQLVVHVSTDHLVGWAWNPGTGRAPAPGTQAEFGKLIKYWIETGAHCPAS